ncbi:hypothetical protein SFA35_12470 [Pseudomonas sp. HR96]|uniref:hypothetical protein n=1 Tax=Pseudomonas sp. HR96 TaxID=1027966 RepID=UPI002A7567E9|nr:hypothetical protein [Pseudomonas sp. HR96]WPP02114.1 hypothetical protein SFA35_12470 [Pseudomonas sp. HR96]
MKEMTDRDIAYYLKSGYAYVESDRTDQNSNTAKNYRFTESANGEIHAEAIDKPGSVIYVASDLIAHEKGVLETRVTLMNRLEGKVLATKSSFMTYGEGLFGMLHALVDIRPEPLACDGPRAEQITNVIMKAIPPKN